MPTPEINSGLVPASRRGGGSIAEGLSWSTSVTESTIRPTIPSSISTIMIRALSPFAASLRRNRLRRSSTGITSPRKLMTPSIKSKDCGRRVIGGNFNTSRTFWISTANSSPCRKKTTNCNSSWGCSSVFPTRLFIADTILFVSITLPWFNYISYFNAKVTVINHNLASGNQLPVSQNVNGNIRGTLKLQHRPGGHSH